MGPPRYDIEHPVIICLVDHLLLTDTGVVDENIQIAKLSECGLKYPQGILQRTHIGYHAYGSATLGPDAIDHCVQFFVYER